jgi:hypothetical protein
MLEFGPGVAAKGGDVAPMAIVSSPSSPSKDLCAPGTIPTQKTPCQLPTFTPNTFLNVPVGTALSPPILIPGSGNR